VPTIHGEKLVIRLLENGAQVPSLDQLGMPPHVLERFWHSIHSPHGFVVVSGPTGSGKTTTLYAALSERNVDSTSICTVEDPVEIRLPGVAQVQVHAKAGVTFASALRSFLRQDPNVLMVGEMRDEETAAVAVSAALSGQLVLTTLHSNDAPRTVQRLLELRVAPHSISAALSAVVAQRLVRRLCERCRRRDTIAPEERRELNVPDDIIHAYRPAGCDACGGTGYRGRIALFEVMFMNDELRDAVAAGASSVRIAEIAARHGYERMASDCVRHVAAGQTSIAEVLRVVSTEGAVA
jgi:type IV pilus assembly protein PilB